VAIRQDGGANALPHLADGREELKLSPRALNQDFEPFLTAIFLASAGWFVLPADKYAVEPYETSQ
jgi:hypothetical protein